MYSYFKGKVTNIYPNNVSILVNNIGYEINVCNPYTFIIDKDYTLYTYLIVREDEMSLYGFLNENEKLMFKQLISVKGIGPKTALAILSSADISSLKSSIINEDFDYLQKFPKIGKKAASQIVLDLKSKFENEDLDNNLHSNNDDVIEALLSLGYNKKEIIKLIKLVDDNLSTENKIKEILQLLVL